MKWTIKWEAQADSNDADYIYTHGTLGVFDDENKEQMQKLLFNMRMAEYAEQTFDDGWFHNVCEREELIDSLSADGKLPKDVVTKLVDKEIGDENDDCFEDHLKDWLNEFVPDDPEDDSLAHDLRITWTKIPGEVRESSFDTDWVEGKV